MRISIYDFDHVLFKTPAPNPELYTPETFKELQNPLPGDRLSWYRNAGILSKGLHSGAGLPAFSPWNEELLRAVKDDMADPDSVPILFCYRFSCDAFNKVIHHIVGQESLKFQRITISDNSRDFVELVEWALGEFPECTELSYYTCGSTGRNIKLARIMKSSYPKIDYFRVPCPYESCFLDPELELEMVDRMAKRYRTKLGDGFRLSASQNGLAFRFDLSQKCRLLALLQQCNFIPPASGLLVPPLMIWICPHQTQTFVLGRFFSQCRSGDPVNVIAEKVGSISGEVYAVKFSNRYRGLEYTYGREPVVLLAFKTGTGITARRHLVEKIRNWRRIEVDEAERTFTVTLGHFQRMDLREA